MGIIISINNHKGGVAKTVTSCNLAHALSRSGKKVLLVDMDPQCNTTSLILSHANGQDKKNSVFEILDVDGDFDVTSCISSTGYKNLLILPNVHDTAMLEPSLLSDVPKNFSVLRDKIRAYAKNTYDFVIIDNPPSLGVMSINSLMAADFVIVPNEAGSRHSVEGLTKAVETIEEIQRSGNPDIKFLRLLITKADKRLSVHQASIETIREIFPEDKVFKTIIRKNTDIQKAEMNGETIFKYKSSVPGAVDYNSVANELISIIGEQGVS